MEAVGDEAGASIGRWGSISLMWCMRILREPPWIRLVCKKLGLLVIATVDVPIVDVLGEVLHVLHPSVHVTHPTIHMVHVLGGLSCEGGEIGVHLNYLLIEHLVCDFTLVGRLRCLMGGLRSLWLRGRRRN
jgi:hypothetical protein